MLPENEEPEDDEYTKQQQDLPTGAELLTEQITQAEETVRRLQVMLDHIEHRRFDVLLLPSTIPLVTHALGLLMDFERMFIERSRKVIQSQEESEEH